jgi:hypothetical protein
MTTDEFTCFTQWVNSICFKRLKALKKEAGYRLFYLTWGVIPTPQAGDFMSVVQRVKFPLTWLVMWHYLNL